MKISHKLRKSATTSRKTRKSKSSRKSVRKAKSATRKSARAKSSREAARKSKSSTRKSARTKSSRKSSSRKSKSSIRKSAVKKSSRKSSRKSKSSSPKKTMAFVIPPEILEKLDQTGYRLGELLGEGTTAVAYEVYKKDEEENKKDRDTNNRYVLKIAKEKRTTFGIEMIPLRKLGELVKELDNNAFIIKYCGESLLNKWRREPNFMPLKDALISLLENVREMHKKGWIHKDIKPDNICVQQSKDGKYRLKLMDFGEASSYIPSHIFGDLMLSKYKKKYPNVKTVNDFKQAGVPIESLDVRTFAGTIFWAVQPILIRNTYRNTYDDVESVALSLWNLYGNGLPWAKYYTTLPLPKDKDVRYEIIRQRLDENLCPYEILREVLREAWNGSEMDLDGLIKRLKEKY